MRDPDLEHYTGVPQKALVTPISSGIWRISVTVPVGHWFLKLSSRHCGALLATTSISGEARAFATGLYVGDTAVLDLATNYIAGSLPFDGATTIYASADGSPVGAVYPVVRGRLFYFDDMRPVSYVVVVNLGLYQYLFTVDFTNKRDAGYVKAINNEDLEKVISSP